MAHTLIHRALARWAWISTRFLSDVSGQDLVEYALILTTIAFITLAGLKNLAGGILTVFVSVGSRRTSAL